MPGPRPGERNPCRASKDGEALASGEEPGPNHGPAGVPHARRRGRLDEIVTRNILPPFEGWATDEPRYRRSPDDRADGLRSARVQAPAPVDSKAQAVRAGPGQYGHPTIVRHAQ